MKQRDYLIHKFFLHGNRLLTSDLISDMQTAAEYRRLLCQLRADPRYQVQTKRLTRSLYEYKLIVIREEPNGQRCFA